MYILWPFCIFYGNQVYLVVIWYIFSVLVHLGKPINIWQPCPKAGLLQLSARFAKAPFIFICFESNFYVGNAKREKVSKLNAG
jgi:hypothetical protein